jgi:hypothetical protein
VGRRKPPKHEPPPYSWNADAHRSDHRTLRWSLAAEGLFRRFLDHAWLEDGLPRNPNTLFEISRCGTRNEFLALWSTIAAFFPRGKDGRLRNHDQELQRQQLKTLSQRRTAAARSRWDKEPTSTPPSKRSAHASPSHASALHLQEALPSSRNANASTPHASALHVEPNVFALDLDLDLDLQRQTQDQKQATPISTTVENRQSAYDGKHRPTLNTVKVLAYQLIGNRKMSSAVWNDVCEKLKDKCAELKMDYEGLPQAALRAIWDDQARKERLDQRPQRRRVG